MSENRRQLLKDAMDNKETYLDPDGILASLCTWKGSVPGT